MLWLTRNLPILISQIVRIVHDANWQYNESWNSPRSNIHFLFLPCCYSGLLPSMDIALNRVHRVRSVNQEQVEQIPARQTPGA